MDAMLTFFQEEGWPIQFTSNDHVVTVQFQGENGQWRCFAQAREDVDQFVFYSLCPINVPPERRYPMADFLTRANFGLLLGNFEFDLNDGEIRYKTSIDVEGGELTPPLVRNLVHGNVVLMDKYLPGILKIVSTDADPLDVITEIESE